MTHYDHSLFNVLQVALNSHSLSRFAAAGWVAWLCPTSSRLSVDDLKDESLKLKKNPFVT